jgi:acyl-CoA reductase-like NAD-dependent aldehyde dehydrogenase
MVFDDEDEVIALPTTPRTGSRRVYTRDLSRAWRIAEALEYG